MAMAVHKDWVPWIPLQKGLYSVVPPRQSGCSIKAHANQLANLHTHCLQTINQSLVNCRASAFFNGIISMKCSTGRPFSTHDIQPTALLLLKYHYTHLQVIWSSEHFVFLLGVIHQPTRQLSQQSQLQHLLTCNEHFFLAFFTNCFKSSPPKLTTRSTRSPKLVAWAM